MRSTFILCNGAISSSVIPKTAAQLLLHSHGKRRNMVVSLSEFEGSTQFADRHYDLLNIAAFVYAADTRISRGGVTEVYADNWTRDLHFTIPVSDPAFWSSPATNDRLTATLSFLTGDEFSFDFVPLSVTYDQQFVLGLEKVGPIGNVDTIVLFSGGVDSLAALIESLDDGEHPLLVSHA